MILTEENREHLRNKVRTQLHVIVAIRANHRNKRDKG